MYFSKKSTCIEHEAIGGILLNKLHVQNDSIKMLINADDQKYSPEDNFNCNDSEINFKGIVDLFKLSCIELKNLELCSDLSSFKFIDYHLDENVCVISKFFNCESKKCDEFLSLITSLFYMDKINLMNFLFYEKREKITLVIFCEYTL